MTWPPCWHFSTHNKVIFVQFVDVLTMKHYKTLRVKLHSCLTYRHDTGRKILHLAVMYSVQNKN